jgi:hypothetical protein
MKAMVKLRISLYVPDFIYLWDIANLIIMGYNMYRRTVNRGKHVIIYLHFQT